MKTAETRIVEYYDDDTEEWFNVEWSSIVSGTLIRIFEMDGTRVIDKTGAIEFYTVSDSYIPEENGIPAVWTVSVESQE